MIDKYRCFSLQRIVTVVYVMLESKKTHKKLGFLDNLPDLPCQARRDAQPLWNLPTQDYGLDVTESH